MAIKCKLCKAKFTPQKSYWAHCNACMSIPRMGCRTCGKEATRQLLDLNSIQYKCCGITEVFYKKGTTRHYSEEVKAFLGPTLGDYLDSTVGDHNGLFDEADPYNVYYEEYD